ncbi:threonylcarbamoyl-AMP synthase [Patescibacteria group bacterium]|nr:threonylcarbamoyl-AMP synthase [Patescibacteria group bacterium]MBU1876936.1 threonylcarbamoyl-AMP synthase [Patescibacteria group bacterium]
MKEIAVSESSEKVFDVIREGGVVIFPTDTIYGLFCDVTNKKAVDKLFKIKKRGYKKPIPVFVKNIESAKKIACINKNQEKFLKKVWPGKVTVILDAKGNFPKKVLSSDNKIGIRIPDYKPALSLLKKLNIPLSSTSANISGLPSFVKIEEVIKQFSGRKNKPDLIVDAGNLEQSEPSTVIDLTGNKMIILRKGAVSIKSINQIYRQE